MSFLCVNSNCLFFLHRDGRPLGGAGPAAVPWEKGQALPLKQPALVCTYLHGAERLGDALAAFRDGCRRSARGERDRRRGGVRRRWERALGGPW